MKKIAILLVLALCFALSLLPVREAIAQPCDCDLTPDTTIITRGQTLEIDVTVTNNTGFAGNVNFAANVTMPDGTTTGWVNGPFQFWIAPYGSPSGQMSYDIPTSWPMGIYTYRGYVGIPGGVVYCQSQFDFVVAMGVPRTGQTTSYGTRDDGELEMGVASPTPRFTDNGDGTVTDSMTGLVWLRNANCFGQRTWSVALSDCNGLASGSCGLNDGSEPGDWRLPNVRELHSLIDYGNYDPALPTGYSSFFTNVQSSAYWSATTTGYSTDQAWLGVTIAGGASWAMKSSIRYVWPVRGRQ